MQKPRIGISSCLLGEQVRYDGGHQRDPFLVNTLGQFVEWVPVCPELEVGMGVPRPPVRLVGNPNQPAALKMLEEASGKDWSAAMRTFAKKRVQALNEEQLSGYIFKKGSPSCGVYRVKVYGKNNMPSRQGRGLFAQALMQRYPLLPVEEEGRLNDPKLRENFVERIFGYQDWQELCRERKGAARLIAFHSRNKFLLQSHSEAHMRKLGRIVAQTKQRGLSQSYVLYGELFMQALAVKATTKKHTNVLQHLQGFCSDYLTTAERKELTQLIERYHNQLVPLIVPITLIQHYVNRYDITYLKDQIYLNPHPEALMIRNHV